LRVLDVGVITAVMRNFFYLLLLGVVLATIAIVVRSGMLARKNPGRPINAAMREAMDAERPQFSASEEMLIDKTYGAAHKLPSGLRYVVRAPGTGDATPQPGHEVICHYDGRLLDGTRFDSSYAGGVPFTFRVGTGAVIKGWDEAFLKMKKGEKCTLIIPYWLAYGVRGSPPKIPPKATLIFEVELIDFR
jgi:FKBP-type peptidyl-prolyl cis-trans isomerase